MKISATEQNTHFCAKLSPEFRKMVGEYRNYLRTTKNFAELNRLQKTMVKIKFLHPGNSISDDFKLKNLENLKKF